MPGNAADQRAGIQAGTALTRRREITVTYAGGGGNVAEPVRQDIWAYHVTAWPEWLENDEDARDDALTLSISVERQGRGDQWALFLGRFGGRNRPAWTSPGGWVLIGEPLLLAEQEALALARQLAPQASITGWSAHDAIASWTREKCRE